MARSFHYAHSKDLKSVQIEDPTRNGPLSGGFHFFFKLMLSICQLSLESVGGVKQQERANETNGRQSTTDNDRQRQKADKLRHNRGHTMAQLSFSFLVSVTDPAELVSPLAATPKPQKKQLNECSEYHRASTIP